VGYAPWGYPGGACKRHARPDACPRTHPGAGRPGTQQAGAPLHPTPLCPTPGAPLPPSRGPSPLPGSLRASSPPASAPPYATLRGMYFTVKWAARVDGPGPQPGVPQWDEESLVIGGTHSYRLSGAPSRSTRTRHRPSRHRERRRATIRGSSEFGTRNRASAAGGDPPPRQASCPTRAHPTPCLPHPGEGHPTPGNPTQPGPAPCPAPLPRSGRADT
jgi:hypothetical protein